MKILNNIKNLFLLYLKPSKLNIDNYSISMYLLLYKKSHVSENLKQEIVKKIENRLASTLFDKWWKIARKIPFRSELMRVCIDNMKKLARNKEEWDEVETLNKGIMMFGFRDPASKKNILVIEQGKGTKS